MSDSIQDFVQAIAERTPEGYYLVNACEENCEGWFSWRQCETCGSTLGGDRHRMAYLKVDDSQAEPVYVDGCVDCMLYVANGDLPQTWER